MAESASIENKDTGFDGQGRSLDEHEFSLLTMSSPYCLSTDVEIIKNANEAAALLRKKLPELKAGRDSLQDKAAQIMEDSGVVLSKTNRREIKALGEQLAAYDQEEAALQKALAKSLKKIPIVMGDPITGELGSNEKLNQFLSEFLRHHDLLATINPDGKIIYHENRDEALPQPGTYVPNVTTELVFESFVECVTPARR